MPPGEHWEIPFPEDLDDSSKIRCQQSFHEDPNVLRSVIVTIGSESNRQYLDVLFRDDCDGPDSPLLEWFREQGLRVPGPHWELYYANDVDGRVEARTHRHQFAMDRNVLSALTTVDEDRNYVLHVRFRQGTLGPRNVGLLSLRDEHRREYLPPSPEERRPVELLTDEQVRQRIVQNFLNSSAGRQQLARSMINPLRQRMDYQSIARQTFLVEDLPQGALPYFNQDPNVVESVVGQVYAISDPEYVGEFPVRQDLPIRPVSDVSVYRHAEVLPEPEIPTRWARLLRDDD